MSTKSVEVTTIDARRFTKPGERIGSNIRIDSNSTILNVSEHKGNALIEFRYTANYTSMGIIKIEGAVIYDFGDGDMGEIMKEFESTRNLPPNDASGVHTAVMQTCIPIATMLSRDIKLPPPIPMPKINVKKKGKNKKKDSGIEVV